MATLTGNSVGSSYLGLLKTSDNAAIDGTLKNMTDGAGNATPLSMANNYVQLQAPTIEFVESTGGSNLITIDATQTYFEGNVDFTNATVTGIGGGAPGLVSGGPVDSMKSAASLTTNPASTLYAGGIALGDGATAGGQRAIVLGYGATSPNQGWQSAHVVIGDSASATQEQATAVGAASTANAFSAAFGRLATATGFSATAIGHSATAAATNSVALGRNATAGSGGSDGRIAIGINSNAGANKSIAIGVNGTTCTSEGIAIGDNVDVASSDRAIAIGNGVNISGSADGIVMGTAANISASSAIALGRSSSATAIESVAIGRDVVASIANTVSVNALEVQSNTAGITMYSPDNTAWTITVTNAGALLVTTA